MARVICLDGVNIALDVDKVEIDWRTSGLTPVTSDVEDCHQGERWQPIMSFQDGSTLFLHCPSDDEMLGYRVDGPNPHKWNITVLAGDEKVARLSWEAA
jgi:hypothetical protein